MRRTALLTALILVVSVSALAQTNGSAGDNATGNFTDNDTMNMTGSDVSTVMLTSAINYPDAAIASTPSNTVGAPILLTEGDSLSTSTREALESLNVENVVIVGGPAVISEDVADEVESIAGNSTTRIWGETQIDTSAAVSEYFWAENQEATVVQYPLNSDEGYKLLTPVKSALVDSEEPLLISDTGNLSSEVVDELERLNVDDVQVYTTNETGISSQLEEIGIQNPEIQSGTIEQHRQLIREETVTEQTENVTVVAAPDFNSSLSSTNLREPSILVTAENETETAIEALNRTQDEDIRVVGNPELAQSVADEIEASTDKSSTLITGESVDIVAQLVTENQETWSQLYSERFQSWQTEIQQSQEIQTLAVTAIARAEAVISITESPGQDAETNLEDARTELENENYFQARNLAIQASSQAKIQAFMNGQLGEVEETIEDETFEEVPEEDTGENETVNESETNETDENMTEQNETAEENETEQNQTDNESTDNFTEENETAENGTETNMTEENQTVTQTDYNNFEEPGSSSINISTEENTVDTGITYVANNSEYEIQPEVVNENNEITFTYEITSSETMNQTLTELTEDSSETGLEAGEYLVNVVINVDGETVNEASQSIEITG